MTSLMNQKRDLLSSLTLSDDASSYTTLGSAIVITDDDGK